MTKKQYEYNPEVIFENSKYWERLHDNEEDDIEIYEKSKKPYSFTFLVTTFEFNLIFNKK